MKIDTSLKIIINRFLNFATKMDNSSEDSFERKKAAAYDTKE